MSISSKDVVIEIIKSNCSVVEELAKALKPYEISLQQFNVLRILRGLKGVAANLSTVQERMVNRMSNTTRLIDKLIDKNYVKRTICEKNRRKIELFITKKGMEILEKIDVVVDKAELKITQRLSPGDRERLVSLLKQTDTKK
jgi:DNA-binding MarR family transcriptional regulator